MLHSTHACVWQLGIMHHRMIQNYSTVDTKKTKNLYKLYIFGWRGVGGGYKY